MALIKCKECGKQISDTANVCMGCGAPVGSGGSAGNNAFENRIEQYKSNGYRVMKRNGDSVEMKALRINDKKNPNMKTNGSGIFVFGMIIFLLGFCVMFLYSFLLGFLIFILGIIFLVPGLILYNKVNIVTVSLTKTGKIEETGNILKK